jgi:hypothetical protein
MRALACSIRTSSHAKRAKNGRVTVAPHSGVRRECLALLYEGAHARFCRESAPHPLRATTTCDVGGKLRRYKGKVLASFALCTGRFTRRTQRARRTRGSL